MQGILGVFGADFFGQPVGPGVLIELIRLVAVAAPGRHRALAPQGASTPNPWAATPGAAFADRAAGRT